MPVFARVVSYQPGAKSDNPAMPNDKVCHCLEGELQIGQGPGGSEPNNGSTIACLAGVRPGVPSSAMARSRDRLNAAATITTTTVSIDTRNSFTMVAMSPVSWLSM